MPIPPVPAIPPSAFDLSLFHRDSERDAELERTVRDIVEGVRLRGDAEVMSLTEKFDGSKVENLRVPFSKMVEAYESLPPEIAEVFGKAASKIRCFHEQRLPESWEFSPEEGVRLGQAFRPIDKVGVYVPGGKACYPSTALMNVIPAQIAGVPNLAVCSPPLGNGLPHPHVMACCAMLKQETLFAMGGAQAVAAFAHGTESVPAANKITGPGNRFVAEAKRQLFGKVDIDSIAGPSELLVLHDRTDIDPEWIARDLLAQAEHDENAKVALLTTSPKIAGAVGDLLPELIEKSARKEILRQSIGDRCKIVLGENLEELIDLTNRIAPEHLELFVESENSTLGKIRNAAAVFAGKWTTTALGDFMAGPNHTLPTNGGAAFSSPLSVSDFMKHSSIVRYDRQALARDGADVVRFARLEGLDEHAESVRVRLPPPQGH